MADPTPFRRSINWNKLRTDEAERLIRERVQDTDNVIISRHALERIRQRFEGPDFIADDLYWILETGSVQPDPISRIRKRMGGHRDQADAGNAACWGGHADRIG